ncbi:MAG TPA: type II secretion system F family protein [Candidatus Tectomicrobia bacterium]|jgi:tight adherence protein C
METFLAGLMTFFSSSPPGASQLSLVIAALASLTLLVTIVGGSATLMSHKAHQELRQRIAGSRHAPSEGPRDSRPTTPGWFFYLLKVAGKANKPHSDEKLSTLRRTLVQAGYRGIDAPSIFLGVKLYLAILVPAVYAAIRPLAIGALPTTALLFVLLAVLGFYAPDIWVRMHIRRRRQKVFEGFPDALDLMVVCVEAGLGLDAAIHKVGEEIQLTNPVLSEEFKLLDLGLRAGQSRQLAMLSLGRRVDVEEVNNFVALLIQTEQFGTSIAQALRVHADAMRLKRRQVAEEKATKLPVKLLFPLLFFIFPSLVLVLLGPGVLRLTKVLSHIIHMAPTR